MLKHTRRMLRDEGIGAKGRHGDEGARAANEKKGVASREVGVGQSW